MPRIQKYFPNENGKYSCAHCEQEFAQTAGISRHVRHQHPTVQPQITIADTTTKRRTHEPPQHEEMLYVVELKQIEGSFNDECDIYLTPTNLVEHAIKFHKKNEVSNIDIVETIQLMLSTRKYILGKEITTNKIDFAEANTLFLAGVAPTKLEKNDLQNLIFKNIVSDDLI
jgi:hypothetical protein